MIVVSDKYKQAIKEPIREISSFVEILVDGNYIKAHETYGDRRISSNDKAEITDLDTVADNDSNYNNYASFEQDYFLLDGSFILPNRSNNKYTGFIGDINSSEINITGLDSYFSNRNLTIYFENGYATDFTIEITALYNYGNKIFTYNYTNNNKEIITTEELPTIVESNNLFSYIKSIKITINNWSNQNHRVRIRQINLGETILYKNSEIIEININEETDIYNFNTPENNCEIKLNNYDRKFNITDENNILNRLNNNTIIRPYYGIKIDGNYEYLSMGNYEYSSYKDESNYYTTLSGIGNVEKLESDSPYIVASSWDVKVNGMANGILDTDSYSGTNVSHNVNVPDLYTNFENKREQIQAIAILSESYIKQTREMKYHGYKNIVKLVDISKNIVDTINKENELEYPKFTKKNKIGKFNIKHKILGTLEDSENTLFEDKIVPIVVRGNNFYTYPGLYISTNQPIKLDTIKVFKNGVQTNDFLIEGRSYYDVSIDLWGFNNDNEVDIKITAKQYKEEEIVLKLDYKEGDLIEYNNNYLRNEYDKKRIANYIMNLEKQYTFEFEMMGDPSLEVGDVILIENVDGYKKGIITSIEFKYNGGLTAVIKGECENVL